MSATPRPNYVALAGEFFVLGELALRGLDATLTLGHTKDIDVLVLNRGTGRTYQVEVKTTTSRARGSRSFGKHYAWFMAERHGRLRDRLLVYCFVLLGGGHEELRVFVVPAADVADYIRWNHRYWLRHPLRRRSGKASSLRIFRIPAGKPSGPLPSSWQDGRWRQWEGNWRVFGPTVTRAIGGTRSAG